MPADHVVRSATTDALLVAASPLVLWVLAGAVAATLPHLVPGLAGDASGGYIDRLLSYFVLTIIGGAFSGLILVFAAVVVTLFAITYRRRYLALARAATGPDDLPIADVDDAAGLADAPAVRRVASRVVDAVMLLGAPPWWLLIPGPLLLVAELFLLVIPAFALGLVPWILGAVATRSGGRRVASVGQLLAGIRPVGMGRDRRLVLTRGLAAPFATPGARLTAAWVSFALGLVVLTGTIAGVAWIANAILEIS